MTTALVIGAGLAGLTCAQQLTAAGWQVTLVDKARGAGGRCSTRRRGALRFDHGAQVITPHDPRFAAWVAEQQAQGHLAPWTCLRVRLRDGELVERLPDTTRLVGTPGNSAPIRALAHTLGVRFQQRVAALTRANDAWTARTADGAELGPFDHIIIATPAPQAAELLAPVAPDLAARAREVRLVPCWAALVAFARRPPVDWDAAQLEGSPLEWAAHDSSKPGRPQAASCWVLHATPAWSAEHLERDADEVARALREAFAELVPSPLPEPVHLTAHRWRYKSAARPLGEPFLHDPARRLSLCGDGCLGERLESAYLSGLALGEHLTAPAS